MNVVEILNSIKEQKEKIEKAIGDITTNKDSLLREYQSKLSTMRDAAGIDEADGISQLISN